MRRTATGFLEVGPVSSILAKLAWILSRFALKGRSFGAWDDMLDPSVQRAILLKAIMEALQKTRGLTQADFYRGKPERLHGPWHRFNAASDTLKAGVDTYTTTVSAMLEEHADALPDDPLWNDIIAFALGRTSALSAADTRVPLALDKLTMWRAPADREHTLSEMGGLWYLFRLSSRSDPKTPEVTVSVLNIRPQSYYAEKESAWTEFVLYLHPNRTRDPIIRVEGICYQYSVQLHFLGLLDSQNSALPTAMVLHYNKGGRLPERRDRTEGLLFVTNSHSQQVSAPVEAVWIPESDIWGPEQYKVEKDKFLARLGSFPQDKVADIFPADAYQALIKRSREALVFEAD